VYTSLFIFLMNYWNTSMNSRSLDSSGCLLRWVEVIKTFKILSFGWFSCSLRFGKKLQNRLVMWVHVRPTPLYFFSLVFLNQVEFDNSYYFRCFSLSWLSNGRFQWTHSVNCLFYILFLGAHSNRTTARNPKWGVDWEQIAGGSRTKRRTQKIIVEGL